MGIVAIAGLGLAFGLTLLAVFAARLGCGRLLGVRGIRFVPSRGEDSWARVALAKQAVCVVAGFAAAYAVPALIFAAALWIGGRQTTPPPEQRGTRVTVMPGRAAEAAGMKDGDRVVAIAGEPVERWDELAKAIQSRPDESIQVAVDRGGEHVMLEVTVPSNGRIGVSLAVEVVPVGLTEALAHGVSGPGVVFYHMATGLKRWLSGDIEAEVGGPVMIVRETARSAEQSFPEWLNLVGALVTFYGLPVAFLLAFIMRLRREPPPG